MMPEANPNNLLEVLDLFEFKKIALFLIGIFLIYIFNRLLSELGKNLTKHVPSKRLLILQVVTISIFLTYIIGVILLVYKVLSPSKELMIAMGGSIAVALGLALKDIVSSLVSGFVLLFDKPFQVGDRVNFSGEYGDIVSIGLRTVRIRTLDDNIVTVPNSRFLTDTVSCANSGNMHMMIVNNFYVDVNCDLKKIEQIAKEVVITSKYSDLKEKVIILFEEVALANNSLAIKVSVKSYVFDTKYEKSLSSDIVLKIEEAFKGHNIKRPILNPISL